MIVQFHTCAATDCEFGQLVDRLVWCIPLASSTLVSFIRDHIASCDN